MPYFVCSKCGYNTTHKYRIVSHFNKKLPCTNEQLIVDANIMNAINGDLKLLKTDNFVIKTSEEPFSNILTPLKS